MNSAALSGESSLCTQCGLCCAGVIYDYGELDPAEAAMMADLGVRLWPEGELAIAFPCPLLDGACCTIYESRPKICRSYRCRMLFERADGAIDDRQASGAIAKAHELVTAVESLLTGDETIVSTRLAWKRNPDFWREAPEPDRTRVLKLVMAMAALNLHLDRHFRHPPQRVIRPD